MFARNRPFTISWLPKFWVVLWLLHFAFSFTFASSFHSALCPQENAFLSLAHQHSPQIQAVVAPPISTDECLACAFLSAVVASGIIVAFGLSLFVQICRVVFARTEQTCPRWIGNYCEARGPPQQFPLTA